MERILTGEDIQGFYVWLKAEEKSQNTIEKYARDVICSLYSRHHVNMLGTKF